MTDKTQAFLPVTQADREAAAPFANCLSDMQDIFDGKADGLPVVQAFARHRQSHSLPGDVGTDHRVDMANVGEALMEAIRDYSGHAFMRHWHPADCPSEIVGDLLTALDEADGWKLVAGLPMWWAGIVTDGEHVAFAQKAEADFDGYYWAVDPEDALEWEPTHCIAAPDAALTPSPCPGDVGTAETLDDLANKPVGGDFSLRAFNVVRCLAKAEFRSELDRCKDEAEYLMASLKASGLPDYLRIAFPEMSAALTPSALSGDAELERDLKLARLGDYPGAAGVKRMAAVIDALSGDAGEGDIPADVRRLVIAARTIAFNDWDGDSEEWTVARKELDDASEAFASRVPWENE